MPAASRCSSSRRPPHADPPPRPPFRGLEHIGLGVSDLDAAAADLRGRGVRFVSEPKESRPGVRIASIEGPDGVPVELIERTGA